VIIDLKETNHMELKMNPIIESKSGKIFIEEDGSWIEISRAQSWKLLDAGNAEFISRPSDREIAKVTAFRALDAELEAKEFPDDLLMQSEFQPTIDAWISINPNRSNILRAIKIYADFSAAMADCGE